MLFLRSAWRPTFRLAAAIGAIAPAGLWADTGDAAAGSPALGPWLFASVALVLVAAASYTAGRGRAHRDANASPDANPARAAPAAAPAPAATAAALIPADDGRTLQALARALAADARPLLLIEHRAAGEHRLRQANAAALRWLGLPALAPDQNWNAVPAALRQALAPGLGGADGITGPNGVARPAGDRGECSDWWLLNDRAGCWCLALGPRQGTEAGGIDEDTASLVYSVSHDLRAPIRVVEGFTRIVKEDYGAQLDRVGNDHLDRVLAAGARMNLMIDAVLAMARLATQPLVRQPVDLSQLAAFVIDELRRAAPERDAEVVIQPGLRVHGDPTLLRLVLENLLGNAWKYSAKTPRTRIEFEAEQVDGQRVFAVRDNGAGFDMRVADRLFGLFQRLHSAKDFAGTGVGLASVRRVVQRHGGRVWAESAPGRGAAFFFTLAE
jgi:signal transduction histidine kinase